MSDKLKDLSPTQKRLAMVIAFALAVGTKVAQAFLRVLVGVAFGGLAGLLIGTALPGLFPVGGASLLGAAVALVKTVWREA